MQLAHWCSVRWHSGNTNGSQQTGQKTMRSTTKMVMVQQSGLRCVTV